ncbi:MAG: Gfo/Idh/MocA family oxidoreductase [Phycisphaerales bacterium]
MTDKSNTPTDQPRPQGPSRREFITRTAAIAGTAAILGTAAKTQAQAQERIGLDPNAKTPKSAKRAPLGENDPIRIGVIGVGGMGTGHVHAMLGINERKEANVQVVALCDVCQPRWENALAACKEKQPDVQVDTYTKHEDLLAREDIHGVVVATTEHWHGPISIDAIAAGKDVYCEKPMTLRLPDALHVRQVVQANPDIIMQVGTQQMMRPKFVDAKKLLAEDAIGKATFSQTSYCRNSKDGEWLYYKIDPSWEPGVNLDWERWCGSLGVREWDPQVYARWRRYKDYSTGIIGDLLVHVMTPMMYALEVGWPTRVIASGGHYVDMAMENHDQVNLTIEFEKGHTMVVAGSTCNDVGLEVMIRGHKANIYLGGQNCVLRPERIFVDDVDEQEIPAEDIGNDQDALRRDWLNSIRTRQPNRSQVDLATQVMVIVDLATRSMWDGHAYTFDPATLSASKV